MNIVDYFGLRPIDPNKEIGIEIEMEGHDFPEEVDYWRLEHDGSLRGNSVEFVLDKPVSRKLVEPRLDTLWHRCRHSTFTPSDRCGVHIHVNCQPLTVKETYRYIILYLMFEDLLVHWCGEDREGNLFCLRSRDAEAFIYNLIKDYKLLGFADSAMNGWRYSSINLNALRKYGSIEFRSLRSPNNPQPIKDWIGMLLKIKDFALANEDPRAFVAQCSAMGGTSFAKEVFGDYFNLLKTKDIDNIILNGTRHVQALAYTVPIEKKDRKTRLRYKEILDEIQENADQQVDNILRAQAPVVHWAQNPNILANPVGAVAGQEPEVAWGRPHRGRQ